MKTLSEYSGSPLRLERKSFFRFEYDFLAGEEVLANFVYRLAFGFYGKVTGFDKKNIEFYKENFWSWEIKIRETGKEIPFAFYKRELGFRSARIELPAGNLMRIHFGFFDRSAEIKDEKGNLVATLKRSGIFTRNMIVTINSASKLLDENPWIILLAQYVLIKRRQRRR